MTLAAVLNSLEGVPESLHDEYTEKDGKFYLDLDGSINTHTSILPLANSLRNVKNEKAALQVRLTAAESRVAGLPDDFDPASYQQVLDELETLKRDPNGNKDTQAELARLRDGYDQRLRAAEQKRVDDLAAKDAEIAERDSVIESTVVGGGLTEALVKAGVAPAFLGAAKALLKKDVKLKREEDGTRVAVVETDLGEVSVEKFVENWSKADEGKHFVTKPAGGGAPGSGSGAKTEGNPWKTGDAAYNLTEQGRLIRDEKPKAERLMKAAGLRPERIAELLAG